MGRDRDEAPAVRVYTVCDESRYLIVRNVPSLGCGEELLKLFGTYGDVEECKPMDAEDCEPFTDVYWIKFSQVSNASFAKRKLDEAVFLGNRIKVSYAPEYETLEDTKEKLEGRRKQVLGRIKSQRMERSKTQVLSNSENLDSSWSDLSLAPSLANNWPQYSRQSDSGYGDQVSHGGQGSITHVSSNKEYFPLSSMNETVRVVREKLDKIQSHGSERMETAQASKRTKVDNRRRI